MSLPSAEVAADFKDALQDLKINSRPEISNLTIIAKENTEHAQAISHELENHIRTTRPEWKLPALYVLDSIVKNVGTPYTVYLGRDLYRTFMDAYLVMEPGTRRAMEGLLKTWKQPVPESMDARPVFQPEVTRDIENALIRIRTVQQQALPQRPVTQQNMPARPMTNMPWGNTPTPPQNVTRFAAPNDPRVRQTYPPTQQYGQHAAPATPPTQYPPALPYAQPVSSHDLESLKADLAKLIATTQASFASNPNNVSTQEQLKALLGLQTILRTQTLPPQQLEQVRNQIKALSPQPAPIHTFPPPASAPPPVIPSPQQQAPPNFPSGLAQLLANVRPPAPPSSTPTPATFNLADLIRSVSTPVQSPSTPASMPSFYPSPFAVGSLPVSAPAPVPAPVPAPAPAPATATPTANLAQLLAQFSQPATAPGPSQPHAPPPPAAPAHGSAEWLLNAIKGLPTSGTSTNSTPLASEPMTRQASAPTNAHVEVELSTASMKKPRLHLISRLYEFFPNICATCGRRFEGTPQGREKKARHMDWHFKVKDPDAAKRGVHRSWYISEKEWIEYREVDETSPEQASNGAPGAAAATKKETKDKYVYVPDPALAHAPCPICQEKFEATWFVEANDFVWMDAVKVNGRIYHATCWEEYSKGAGIATPSTPDSILGKRKAEVSTPTSGKKVRAY